jgi:hypothetical protein
MQAGLHSCQICRGQPALRELAASRCVFDTNEETTMGRGLLLWLIGIPLPIILVIWLLGGLS